MLDRLISFIGFAAVLTAIPGPAIVLIMKNAVLRGRRNAMVTGVGVFCGDLVWISASLAGLTAVLAASRPAFEVLRFAGAAYLIYLGCRLLFAHRDDVAQTEVREPLRAPLRASRGQAFTQGALCELSNPKALVVFTSVIPPFLPAHGGAGDLAVFGLTFATVGLVSCLAYGVVLGGSRRLIRRPRLTRGLMRGSGGVLAAFGVGLAVEGVRSA